MSERAWGALAALGIAATTACAPMSAGDCTDKGTCPADAAAPTVDATVQEPGVDAADSAADDAGVDASFQETEAGGAGDSAAPDATLPPADAGDSGEGADAADAEDGGEGVDAAGAVDAGGGPDAADAEDAGDCDCVAAPPTGWSGPVALAQSAGTPSELGDCLAPYSALALDGNADPIAPAAACGCSCGAVAGATCAPPTIGLYPDGTCSSSCATATPTGASCASSSLSGCGAAPHAKAPAPLPSGGACQPQPSTSVPAATWGTLARACALPSPAARGACDAASVCAPRATSPYSGHLCALIAGDVSCPAGSAYNVKHVYYAGADDSRACSPCTCGPPDGGACTGTFSVYNTSACALFTSTFSLGSSCVPVQIATSGVESQVSLATAGGCAASLVQPSGGFTPSLPTTVCCAP